MCQILSSYDPYTASQEIQQLSALYEISFALDRMYKNILLINSGFNAKTIEASNTTLFQIASEEYQDATLWTYLADVNNLLDFNIMETITLIVPPKPVRYVGFGV